MKYALIVDAYSAGNLLAPEFHRRDIPCLHVQSTKEIWPVLLPTFREEDFLKRFTFEGSLESLIDELRPYDLVCAIPGTETGVELADEIAQALKLPGNGIDRSAARRDKYLMGECVRQKGMRAVRQIRTESVEDVLEWQAESGLPRVVIKPLKSAGTDSVAICESPEQVRRAVNAILGRPNMLGLYNSEVLAQEFLEGTEFFLNTVSRRGHHHFTEIWKYRKRSINGHDCVYDCNELLPFEGEPQRELREYVLGVLNALEIQFGPAHTEVMLTDTGPVLVECGARLDGLSVPGVNQACVGYGPVDLTVDAYADATAFETKARAPFALRQHALTVYFTSYEPGTVAALPGEDLVRSLESFYQLRLRVKPGSPVKQTIDYFTAPGFCTLVHSDKALLWEEYAKIRSAEREGRFFTLNTVSSTKSQVRRDETPAG